MNAKYGAVMSKCDSNSPARGCHRMLAATNYINEMPPATNTTFSPSFFNRAYVASISSYRDFFDMVPVDCIRNSPYTVSQRLD